jgi:hypothetical protein
MEAELHELLTSATAGSDQLHAPAALPVERKFPVYTGYEAE